MDNFRDIVDLALSYEEEFSNDHYYGCREFDNPTSYILGDIPIILSAPHTLIHSRLMEQKMIPPDLYTGGLAKVLHKLTGCYLIYTDKYLRDFNKWYVCYTHTLKDIITEHKIGYLIDLHGANEKWPFDVEIGTDYGKSICSHLVKDIEDIFVTNGIESVYENNPFTASKITTITNFTYKKLGIPSMQIEINRRLREPNYENELFYNLVKSIKEIIEYLNGNVEK